MGLEIQWCLGCGSDNAGGTVGSWTAGSKHAGTGNVNMFSSTDNDFYLTGVQFEAGSVATPFENISFGESLARCQRYYYSITPPIGFINATEDLGVGWASSGTEVQFRVDFKVQMRATPSVYNESGTNYYRIGGSGYGGDKYISNAWIVNNMSPTGGNLYVAPVSNLSSQQGQAASIQLKDTSARLAMQSEL